MAEMNLSSARALCSAAEYGLVQASFSRTVGEKPEKLVALLDRARKLRDKWRDVATKQRRQTQQKQAARTTDKNARSEEKAQLFNETVARLEIQMKKLGGVGAVKAETKKAGSRGITKPQRNKKHRAERSTVRGKMNEKRLLSVNEKRGAGANAGKAMGPAKKKTAATKGAAAKTAAATKPAAMKSKPAKKTSLPPKMAASVSGAAQGGAAVDSPPATDGVMTGLKKLAAKQGMATPKKNSRPQMAGLVSFDPTEQRLAQAAAKQRRIQVGGIDTRMRGHIAARTRRAQARRDSR